MYMMTEEPKHPGIDDTGRFEQVVEVEKGGYSWAIATVWRDKATGKLYGDTDSGCSCFGPWDVGYGDFHLANCKQITHVREAAELLDEVHGEDGVPSPTERQDFTRAVEVALASA